MTEPEPARTTALYEAVRLGTPIYTREDLARMAGIDRTRSVRWWRALGFPEVPDGVSAFSEQDVDIVRRLAATTGAGVVDDEAVLRLARVLGASCSRVAEAQVALLGELFGVPSESDGVPGRARSFVEVVDALDSTVLGFLEESVVYVWRRHLLAALGRRLDTRDTTTEAAVGFADLSGFTRLSQRVSPDRLAAVVDTFEEAASDVISARAGRAVKFIGDEVMFTAESLAVAVDIGLDLADRLRAAGGDMPPMHCGIAHGRVVAVGGDVFGPAVNLAARLTTIARPGTILVTRRDAEALADRDGVELVRVRQRFDLKGIGDTRVVAVRRRAEERDRMA
jgi:adenylate cyclase